MSWRDPNDFEQALPADTCQRWPEVIPLARCLTLAPRVEPLLLRNARRRFVPQAQAEVESLLWFSPKFKSVFACSMAIPPGSTTGQDRSFCSRKPRTWSDIHLKPMHPITTT